MYRSSKNPRPTLTPCLRGGRPARGSASDGAWRATAPGGRRRPAGDGTRRATAPGMHLPRHRGRTSRLGCTHSEHSLIDGRPRPPSPPAALLVAAAAAVSAVILSGPAGACLDLPPLRTASPGLFSAPPTPTSTPIVTHCSSWEMTLPMMSSPGLGRNTTTRKVASTCAPPSEGNTCPSEMDRMS